MAFLPAHALAQALAGRLTPILPACARFARADVLVDAGPVFLPAGPELSLRRLEEEPSPAEDERRKRLALCAFGLSLSSARTRQALFQRLCTGAGHTLFLDFKTPERNLELPAALLFSPLRRLLSCGELERMGGMEGLLYAERERFAVLSRHTLTAGALCAVLVQNRA